jgi:alkylation response protein AidB-like acyl-CoA dehydrogenase
MNFDYSDDQKMLKDEARKFLASKCDTKVVRGVLDNEDRAYDEALWKGVAEQGWLGAAMSSYARSPRSWAARAHRSRSPRPSISSPKR